MNNATAIRQAPIITQYTRDLTQQKPPKRLPLGTPKQPFIPFTSSLTENQKLLTKQVMYNLARELNEVAKLKQANINNIKQSGRVYDNRDNNFFFGSLNELLPNIIQKVVDKSVSETQTDTQPQTQPQIPSLAIPTPALEPTILPLPSIPSLDLPPIPSSPRLYTEEEEDLFLDELNDEIKEVRIDIPKELATDVVASSVPNVLDEIENTQSNIIMDIEEELAPDVVASSVPNVLDEIENTQSNIIMDIEEEGGGPGIPQTNIPLYDSMRMLIENTYKEHLSNVIDDNIQVMEQININSPVINNSKNTFLNDLANFKKKTIVELNKKCVFDQPQYGSIGCFNTFDVNINNIRILIEQKIIYFTDNYPKVSSSDSIKIKTILDILKNMSQQINQIYKNYNELYEDALLVALEDSTQTIIDAQNGIEKTEREMAELQNKYKKDFKDKNIKPTPSQKTAHNSKITQLKRRIEEYKKVINENERIIEQYKK